MRLQVTKAAAPHAEGLTGVAWTAGNDVWACSEDQALWRWPAEGNPPSKVCELDAPCSSLHWYPCASRKPQPGATTDVFLLAADDGTFRLMRANGREEKRVDAHAGPLTAIQWNQEGTAVATGGQDGALKIWSRSGMLRSVLAQIDGPVLCLAWSPDAAALVYPRGGLLLVAPLAAGARPLQWRAHDAPILAVDWSPAADKIASGGEDAIYKVWDTDGRPLFQSAPLPSACTALAWAPGGCHLAVATRGAVYLCESSGVFASHYSFEGSMVRSVAWSCDGSRLAVGGAGGLLAVGHMVKRRVEWGSHSALLAEPARIRVQEVGSAAQEELEVREAVVAMSFAYDHLLVATAHQVAIYGVASWNTPVVVEVADTPLLLLQAERLFLLADPSAGVQLLSYTGRTLATPKWQGLRPEALTGANCSLSNDTLAVVDRLDPRCVRCLSTATGQPVGEPLRHSQDVLHVALSQGGTPAERRLALIDRNRDLYCTALQSPALGRLGAAVEGLAWHAAADVLLGLAGGRVLQWAAPGVLAADPSLLPATTASLDVSQHGPRLELVAYGEPAATLRTPRGTLVHVAVSPYPLALAQAAAAGRWEAATRLCRCVADDGLWAALAARALAARETATAEAAYAALGQVAMVDALAYIRALPREEARAAQLAVLQGRIEEAEGILLQAGLVYRAIKIHIRAKNWDRALEVAVKQKSHVDTVLWYRGAELAVTGREETHALFLQFSQQVEINEEQIRLKICQEKERESQGSMSTAKRR
ncbi:intraflagellar transport protein 80 homolog [Klebsormidium nitens]|uniref:Intraflagellar transport protein 80 homolog n=1 Tax=Klebsormidium nitens TaxID=105231 RepID=A0A1Y1INS1_KLENI|nr:intraflagellar transport protein 80 homolog [Klebsormidium nitens]|eukprot:GAQ90821.1 intraflagellar transport protein 80 homolog [Klebsormidium nitens]